MNDSSKKLKRTAVSLVTIILLLVILISIGVILYSNKLLPEGLHDYLRSQIEEDEKDVANSGNTTAETPFYEVEFELDLPKYNEIEIMDLANIDTMLSGSFSQSTVDEISIIKADGKYGLISNQTGSILIEPTYDRFIKEMSTGDKFEKDLESIYGERNGKYDIISLLTYKTKKDVTPVEHLEGAYEKYDVEKEMVWHKEQDNFIEYKNPDEKTLEKYELINTEYGLCIAGSQKEQKDEVKHLYGYYDLKTGKILIKPEFEKATFFQDGVAGVVKDGKGYYISENNVRISEDYFENVTGMHKFKSWIKQDGKWKLAKFPKVAERSKIVTKKEKEESKNVINESIDLTNTTSTTNSVNTVNDETKNNNTSSNKKTSN